MDFDIKPYLGVGAVRFGMTPDEVHRILGQPSRVDQKSDSLREGHKDECQLTFEGEDQFVLVEIGFTPQATNLTYDGLKVFAKRKLVLQRLLKDDPDAGELLGFLVFPNLGITLTGFHSGVREELAATVFTKGYWDEYLPRLKPYSQS